MSESIVKWAFRVLIAMQIIEWLLLFAAGIWWLVKHVRIV